MAIEYRTAEHYDRLPALAAELVRRPVTVMYTTGDVASLVAKTATAMTPIVFAMGEDPIQAGLVVSPNRPGGNRREFFQWHAGCKAARILARADSPDDHDCLSREPGQCTY